MLVRVIGEDIKLTNVLINRELTVMADRGQIEQSCRTLPPMRVTRCLTGRVDHTDGYYQC